MHHRWVLLTFFPRARSTAWSRCFQLSSPRGVTPTSDLARSGLLQLGCIPLASPRRYCIISVSASSIRDLISSIRQQTAVPSQPSTDERSIKIPIGCVFRCSLHVDRAAHLSDQAREERRICNSCCVVTPAHRYLCLLSCFFGIIVVFTPSWALLSSSIFPSAFSTTTCQARPYNGINLSGTF